MKLEKTQYVFEDLQDHFNISVYADSLKAAQRRVFHKVFCIAPKLEKEKFKMYMDNADTYIRFIQ